MDRTTYSKAAEIIAPLEYYETIYNTLGNHPKVEWIHIKANNETVYLPSGILDHIGKLISESCQVQTVNENILYVNIDKIAFVQLMKANNIDMYRIELSNNTIINTYDDISTHLDFKISKGKSY